MPQKIEISYEESNTLRGLAIFFVVLIHFFAYLKGIYTTSDFQILFITIDQLGRFCVPLFLILSGYGLTKKYSNEKIELKKFIQSKVLKLIPVYLVWSLVSYVLFSVVSIWKFVGPPESLVVQLLFGRADYQLYFLPLIFQLYLLFPFVLKVFRRSPSVTTVVALIIQACLYVWFARDKTITDQMQYVFCLTWIGYFVAGMWLAQATLSKTVKQLILASAVLSGIFVIYSAWQAIVNGIDPIIALRFTKIPMILYGISVSFSLIFAHTKVPAKLFNWLGQESYLIFLSHTLGLRLVYALFYFLLPWPVFLLALLTWITTILFSKKLS